MARNAADSHQFGALVEWNMDMELSKADADALENIAINLAKIKEQTDRVKLMMKNILARSSQPEYVVESFIPPGTSSIVHIPVGIDSEPENTTVFVEVCDSEVVENLATPEELQMVSDSDQSNLIFKDESIILPVVDATYLPLVDAEDGIISHTKVVSMLQMNENKDVEVESEMNSEVSVLKDMQNLCTPPVRQNVQTMFIYLLSTGKPPPLPPEFIQHLAMCNARESYSLHMDFAVLRSNSICAFTLNLAEFLDDSHFTNGETAMVSIGCKECLMPEDYTKLHECRNLLRALSKCSIMVHALQQKRAGLQHIVKLYQCGIRIPYIFGALERYSGQFSSHVKEKIISSVQMLLSCKNEQDEMKVAHDSAFRAVEVLRQQAASTMSIASLPLFLSEYSYSGIASGTCYFHPSLKVDERGSRRIYKGILHHIEVDLKMLYAYSLNGPSKYKLEVDALIRLHHPNIVTLIGVCPEALAMIYEHLPNGTLEDRPNFKDNSPPLTWQGSVLILLHSSKPQGFVHGALNPSNILFDDKFTSKLSHLGTCCAITTLDLGLKYHVDNLGSMLKRLIMQRTAIEGFRESHGISPFASCTNMDPESIITRDTTPRHDVYSFGKIILRLLTGKVKWGVTRKVQCAPNDGTLGTLLDCSTGVWPYMDAQQLPHIVVRCTDRNRGSQPHPESKVLELLGAMNESCQASSTSSTPVGDQSSQLPPYIVCHIYQDVMQNPNVAAYGFTYQAEAAGMIYTEEMKVRKEGQDLILRHKHKLKSMSSQLVSLMEELNSALKKKSLLEGVIDESKKHDKELKESAERDAIINGFLFFSLPRPPEVVDLEDKVIFKGRGMIWSDINGLVFGLQNNIGHRIMYKNRTR